jgi:amylosucrase
MYDATLHARLRTLADRYAQENAGPHLDAYLYRLSANLQRIRALMARLYGSCEDFDEQFWLLVDELFVAFQARSAELRTQDLTREADPGWLQSHEWVGMMLYVDRFAGQLSDVQAKLDYLEELGVNWLHLMPLLQAPEGSNDGGYAVSDYRAVDPKFGDLQQLKALAREMRQRGQLLTLDLVMNHTSDQHEWAQKAKQGERHYRAYYHLYPDRQVPDQYEASLPEIFPESSPGNFTYVPALGQWVMTVFHSYQWDLNYRNPEVFREMLQVLLFLGNLGVDLLRLDAVAFTWKQLGTTSQNLPQAHWILQLMKACAQVVAPGLAFIAEAIVAPQEVVRYFGTDDGWGRECEVAYHATFMALLWDALATGETAHLNMSLRDMPSKPVGCTWINYLRCHDDIGLGYEDHHLYALGRDPRAHKRYLVDYYSGQFPGSHAKGAPFAFNPKTGDARISGSLAALTGLEWAAEHGTMAHVDRALRRIQMMHSIILAYGGLPLLYYGDEVGTPNDDRYLSNPDQAYDNRWMHRPILDWDRVARRQEPGTIEHRLFGALRHLIALRQASPELADHNRYSIEDNGNPHLFTFLRWDLTGSRTFCVANFTDTPQLLSLVVLRRCGLDPTQLIDKVSGQPMAPRSEGWELPGYGYAWLTEPATYMAMEQRLKARKK